MAQIFETDKLDFLLRDSSLADFSWHTSPELSKIVKSKYFKFDIRSLDPGKYSFPYHFHRNAEELFVILSGKALLRTPKEYVEIKQGSILFFEAGPSGAHQLYNHTEQPCVYLDLRSQNEVDICEYPDSSKINILPYQEVYSTDSRVDYYAGEEEVSAKWPEEILKKFVNE